MNIKTKTDVSIQFHNIYLLLRTFVDVVTKKGERTGLQCVIFISSPVAKDSKGAKVLLDELAPLLEAPGGLKNWEDKKRSVWTCNGSYVCQNATR